MRMISQALIVAGALALLPSFAHADDMAGARKGWYATLGGGLNILRNSDISGGGFETHADFDKGYVVNGAVGYSWGNLRAEGELGYRRNGVDSLSNFANGNGHAASFDLMANGYYDFLPDSAFDPYIGVGIGVARVNFDSISGGGKTLLDDSDTKFAYQGIVGARYLVAPQWDLGAEYRYFATLTPSMTTTSATTPASVGVDTPYRNHSIMVGLTYHFGAPAPAPMAQPAAAPAPAPAPAAPPPAPAAAAMPNVYLVFFEFDKANISAVSAQVLDRAIADFQKSGSVKFLVQGYTDSSGPAAYNDKLSERRAEAVKKYLLGHGVRVDQITTEWYGEKNLRVPTADGVKNQENRRAEIYLKK